MLTFYVNDLLQQLSDPNSPNWTVCPHLLLSSCSILMTCRTLRPAFTASCLFRKPSIRRSHLSWHDCLAVKSSEDSLPLVTIGCGEQPLVLLVRPLLFFNARLLTLSRRSGAYSSWFTTYSKTQTTPDSTLLLNVLNYVVTALTDPALCLQAAVALRNLCDANRKALAPHVAAFGQLHDGLERIPVCIEIPVWFAHT